MFAWGKRVIDNTSLWINVICCLLQELYAKLNRMASIAAEMFVGRERFATLLMMRLTETVILWLSEDQAFWEEIEQGAKPLGPLGLQQVSPFTPFYFLNSCGVDSCVLKIA